MNFTIIVPSRGRPLWASKLIDSIKETVYDPFSIEVVFVLDSDDVKLIDYRLMQEEWNNGIDVKIVIQKRTEMLCEDYINKQARLSKAKYIWPLNDDCVVATKHWDKIACENLDKKKIFYGRVRGTNHMLAYAGQPPASGFPLLNKNTVDILGYFFDPRIKGYGAEGTLYWTFHGVSEDIILETGIEVNHYGGTHLND